MKAEVFKKCYPDPPYPVVGVRPQGVGRLSENLWYTLAHGEVSLLAYHKIEVQAHH